MDEINVMKKVSDDNNPHVLKMLGCVTATNPMMLVLQFVPQGNLKNYLRAMNTADNVRNALYLVRELNVNHCLVTSQAYFVYRYPCLGLYNYM